MAKVLTSMCELVRDEIKLELAQSEINVQERELKPIWNKVESFLRAFYTRMERAKNANAVKDLADRSKESTHQLEDMISMVLSSDYTEEYLFMLTKNNGEYNTDSAKIITEVCPWYVNHKCLFATTDCNGSMANHVEIALQVSCYKYILHAVVYITRLLVSKGIGISELDNYHFIYQCLMAVCHIYELMNPSGEVRRKMEDDAIELLTQQPISYSTPEWCRNDQLFEDVKKDILTGNQPYVREFKLALRRARYELNKEFSSSDFYMSMKSSGQKGYTSQKYSLLSSGWEVDIHKENPEVIEFDNLFKYQSAYIEPSNKEKPLVSIRTIGINNPSKYKIRVIHIADNPIQDRCGIIHRGLSRLLSYLPNDCTKDQERGRKFLKNLTQDWYLSDYNDRIGIYCTDFSNATDTVDQLFTHKVLELVYGNEVVANFWDYVSNLDKIFIHADGTEEVYHQSCGQPQGVLGSFDIFALCHHILFLMDMKQMGLEKYRASEFYHILGDDAVYNSILPERMFLEEGFSLDEMGIRRSSLEMVHFEKCKHYAGFKINYDKSASAHFNSRFATLDFAKVTFRNGQFFSAIPFRLAMKYSHRWEDKFAVALWRGERGEGFHKEFMDYVIARSPDPDLYGAIIRCGEIPFLVAFADHNTYDEQFCDRLKYCYILSSLTGGLSFTIINDGDRERAGYGSNYDQFNASLKSLFTTRVDDFLELNLPDEHKLMQAWYDNADIVDALQKIYETSDFDDRFITMCVSSFLGHLDEESLRLIYEVGAFNDRFNKYKTHPEYLSELREDFPKFGDNNIDMKKISLLSNRFLTRGITNRPNEESYIFRNMIILFKDLNATLDEYNEDNMITNQNLNQGFQVA
jgi:hypothetical protein